MADSSYDEDRIEELREAFDYNDRDGDGKIEIGEFVTMLDELDAGVTAAEARLGFQDIDNNDDGLIDFDEFVAWWAED